MQRAAETELLTRYTYGGECLSFVDSCNLKAIFVLLLAAIMSHVVEDNTYKIISLTPL